MMATCGAAALATPAGATAPLEMWAGLECTINRVGFRYRDQLAYAGHYDRADDAERLADLGVRTVRYPVLWERHHTDDSAWKITDRVLEIFRKRGVEVVAGLVHHGSGPRHTDLLDSGFAAGLAQFARIVAQRYPWIGKFTPINEPLTTARFSALYGVWYPHARNDAAFVRAMLNQASAIQAAMVAIREVTPGAALVQTEDLGYTHSTARLAYQARFENERRWLTFDLLTGRVRPGHRLWKYLNKSTPVRDWLARIAAHATDERNHPALLGINHYLTSERFLDDRLSYYPRTTVGGNGRHRYVDVEAVRVLREGPLGPRALLQQTWDRYHAPIAVTEAHLACTREQQMLWLSHIWNAALEARASGVDVRAVTAWSVMGAFDWRTLLTKEEFAYESGVFDLRSKKVRATALVPMVHSLATTGAYAHPALDAVPWWERDERILHPRPIVKPARTGEPSASAIWRQSPARVSSTTRPLMVTGGNGTLGRALVRIAHERGLAAFGQTRRDLDITDPVAIERELDAHQPWAIINAAGWVRVDHAEQDAAACMKINAAGAEFLAQACARRGIPFVTFSSDLVFDGSTRRPYVESDLPAPQNVYGRSKLEAERRVLDAHEQSLVVRTSAFFGDWDDWNFVSRSLAVLHSGGHVRAPDDAVVSPTYVPDLVNAVLDLLIDGERGIWHLANVGAFSWIELARAAAQRARLDPARIERCRAVDIGWTARRPSWSVLGSERATLLTSVDDALDRYVRSRAWERVARTLRSPGLGAGTNNGLGVAKAAHLHAST